MNITQQKELTAIARQALALLDPEWAITSRLQERLAAVLAVKAPAKSVARGMVIKGAKRRPDYTAGIVTSDGLTSLERVRAEYAAGIHTVMMERPKADPFIGAAALRDKLSHCACSHDADRHEEDELNNLLKCADCDCEQFHYSEDQKAAA